MKFKHSHLALLVAIQLSGCSSVFMSDDNICFNDNGKAIDCSKLSNSTAPSPLDNQVTTTPIQDASLFKSKINFQLLNEYVEQMAMNIKDSMNGIPLSSPIAVTSFVNLDSSLKNTNVLGNQISEYFINELKNVGLPISDHKVTGFIQVTPNGDLAMSRQYMELKQNLNIGYVLTGTLVENERGMIVNARVVSLHTNNVIASNSKLIPSIVTSKFN